MIYLGGYNLEVTEAWTDSTKDLVDLEYIFYIEANKEIDR